MTEDSSNPNRLEQAPGVKRLERKEMKGRGRSEQSEQWAGFFLLSARVWWFKTC